MNVWDWNFAGQIIPALLNGLRITLIATVLGSLIAFVLGLVLAILGRGPRPVRIVVRAIVEFIRSTPLLVQVYFLFFVLPAFGVVLPALTVGVLALGVHYATYTSEVYRAGIDAVPRGQWEAATALSLPRTRVWTGVVLPQAIPRVLPALGNYVISMFKETPLLIGIGVLDIVGQVREVGGQSFRYVEAYTLAGLLFLLLSYPASLAVRRLERRRAVR
ncbi:MAG: ectoine/hydroxyectoine ABC transporter permease subunit EhuD [Pseudonocardia sp.]|uniref:ectoine/hydroxyectoine ABC transporter permease subunit EhuD n=1 Tax=unclassified Pseudonocardia TaxID=2619320 RepID=UPI00086D275B|nr:MULTISPECIES: ectoine/hydroxyectoine ABC transporter permease subunit EhuD [unclassified Pseudonocardia]MBN9109973.1 ectoine/hydroxyectoine ABC transporter permease subunit EhuD [Pseudonocardia sp.]ODU25389.1 MAG: ectoine/hydroxyectoine ABC transporter permease subunit EhuD [Pseudonocardia sp. SCN 72-51]ODV03291.1 MAG: ectoine/hydroxyectoine ABC transporter permease subunit EhuD [Pseudonocardia sp. SCN 73-27]